MEKRGIKINPSRDEDVSRMFLSGLTQEEIGRQFGCTRQNINLILKRNGIGRGMGGVCLRATVSRAKASEKRKNKFIKLYGLQEQEFKTPKILKLYKNFLQQRSSAKTRCVGWELKFSEWLDVWGASGKIPFRGRGKNSFCMGRIGDSGPYKKGNVYICSNLQNSKDNWANKPDMKIRLWSGKNNSWNNRTHCIHGHDRSLFFYRTPLGHPVCRECNRLRRKNIIKNPCNKKEHGI